MTDQEKLQEDLRRRHLLLEEQLTYQRLYQQGFIMGAGGLPPRGAEVQFVVDTNDDTTFEMSITISDPTSWTIDWGHGEPEEFEYFESGQANISHTFPDGDEQYNVTITFNDPLKITELDIQGW